MRKGRVSSAIAGSVCALALANAAHAGFQFNYTLTPGTGALAGKNVFCLFAKNDGQGDQLGSKSLLAFDIRVKPQGGPLTFKFTDLNNDGVPDADVMGETQSPSAPTGTFLRVGSAADFMLGFLAPTGYRSTSGGTPPATTYANLADFNLVGFSMNKNLDATQGLGQFYGAVVVPEGVNVVVSGMVGAEKGPAASTPSAPVTNALGGGGAEPKDYVPLEWQQAINGASAAAPLTGGEPQAAEPPIPFFHFQFTAFAPEPGTFGVATIAAVTALTRRRRRA